MVVKFDCPKANFEQITMHGKWKIEPNEIQLPYDITDLYQSTPLYKSIQVIIELLQEDHPDENMTINLNLPDNHQVKELCLKVHSWV